MDKDKILSVATNLAYGLAGVAQWIYQPELIVSSIWLILLMLGSGYHHLHLKDFSRKWDYLAMYGALSASICYGLWGLGVMGWLQPPIIMLMLWLLFGDNRYVVAGLAAVLLITVLVVVHPVYAIFLTGLSALPFTFNMLGDTALKHQYDPVHGIGWHLPTAALLAATNIILWLGRTEALPLL